MLTQEQVDKILEETLAKMKEIDEQFEKTKRFIEENQGNFSESPEIKAQAAELLAQAKRRAELEGRERAFAQENAAAVGAPAKARRSRGLMI